MASLSGTFQLFAAYVYYCIRQLLISLCKHSIPAVLINRAVYLHYERKDCEFPINTFHSANFAVDSAVCRDCVAFLLLKKM